MRCSCYRDTLQQDNQLQSKYQIWLSQWEQTLSNKRQYNIAFIQKRIYCPEQSSKQQGVGYQQDKTINLFCWQTYSVPNNVSLYKKIANGRQWTSIHSKQPILTQLCHHLLDKLVYTLYLFYIETLDINIAEMLDMTG